MSEPNQNLIDDVDRNGWPPGEVQRTREGGTSIPLSILDLAPIRRGETANDSFRASVKLAQRAEQLGYRRVWYAEHHNIASIASSATSVLIAHVAANTAEIRLGAGGIMLPNHSPLTIAEQFGTLESLHPGRIDLGLGRAPGSDQSTMRALRRNGASAERFPEDVLELQGYLGAETLIPGVEATPGKGTNVPLYILGSSMFGAALAATLGLPYAFASHFAPADMEAALNIYRSQFKPSEHLAKPHVMLGLNVVAAETDAEAMRLFTSLQQAFINLRTGNPGPLPPPVDDIEALIDPSAHFLLQQTLSRSVVGSPATVKAGLEAFIARTQADEIMVTAQIFDHAARVRSFEITAEVHNARREAA